MTTWYVRPSTSHSATRNGTSYATAWGGWSEITWGASGVTDGDTLYVCGEHAYDSGISVGNHGASEEAERVTIASYPSDPGSITFTGSSILTVGRSYTTLSGLTITAGTGNCIFTFGAIVGLIIVGCTLNGSTGSPVINISGGNGYSQTDLTVNGNDFIGGGGSNGSAISWLVAASGTPVCNLNRVTISDNSFTGCSATRAVVCLRIEDSGSEDTNMADIVATGNTFDECYAVAMEIYGPGVYGRNTGIQVTDNIIRDQMPLSTFGGGISVGGFGPSLTDGFGDNVIARNRGYRLEGPTGLVNVFYGTYVIHNNYGEDLSTHTIDGNGILFDHGADDCVAYANEFRRLTGNDGVANSGCGIMVLDATNCTAYGNIVNGCRVGLYVGNKGSDQSSDIRNNTFTGCTIVGLDILSTADMETNLVRNNIYTTADSEIPSVSVASGTFLGESYNCFHGFGSASGHTLDENTVTTDPELDVILCSPVSAIRGGGVFVDSVTDFYGKAFRNPPIIGAVEVSESRTRLLCGV